VWSHPQHQLPHDIERRAHQIEGAHGTLLDPDYGTYPYVSYNHGTRVTQEVSDNFFLWRNS